MNDVRFDKTGVLKYLVWSFLIAWLMQVAVAILYRSEFTMIGQLLLFGMMFAPLLGVILSGHKLAGLGWKPQLKGKVKTLLTAWFLPAFLTALGTALYFAVFPEHLDTSGNYLMVNGGAEILAQLEAQGFTYPVYILISAIASLTYAPLLNMIFAVGEEAGWRGFLYPQLKAKFGQRKAWLLGGIIWGMWHWPLIGLIGYEYGTDYAGFPILGMLIFCFFTITVGILCDWLYEKSGIIWIPSIFHGAINAAATVPLAMCLTNTDSMRLLGPAPMGLLAELPLILCATIVWLKSKKAK